MRIFIFYGYILGFTFASPITRFPKCKEGLKRIDNADKNGAHQEETACKEVQLHTAEILKITPKIQSTLNYTGVQGKLNETRIKKQTSSNEMHRNSMIKYRHRRDLSQLIQKHPKRKTGGKKQRPQKTNKIIQSHNLYNKSRKLKVNDMLKHKLEKGTIVKQLQKRSNNFEDITNEIPYHSPDISYDWDMQEDFNNDPEELNVSARINKKTEDFTLDIINENSEYTDSRESYPISSSESRNILGSFEINNPMEPNISNSSNEFSYSSKSEESISDVRSEESISDVRSEDFISDDVRSEDFISDVRSEESISDVRSEDFISDVRSEDFISDVRSEDFISDVRSEDFISDVSYKPIILKESSNSQESSELNVQNGPITIPVSDTRDGLSESMLSSDFWSQENSSQINGHGESSNSSDAIDSSSNESSNSCTSNDSNHSTESTVYDVGSTEHDSWYIVDTVITDNIEANKVHT